MAAPTAFRPGPISPAIAGKSFQAAARTFVKIDTSMVGKPFSSTATAGRHFNPVGKTFVKISTTMHAGPAPFALQTPPRSQGRPF